MLSALIFFVQTHLFSATSLVGILFTAETGGFLIGFLVVLLVVVLLVVLVVVVLLVVVFSSLAS